jgi:hypothetical protein
MYSLRVIATPRWTTGGGFDGAFCEEATIRVLPQGKKATGMTPKEARKLVGLAKVVAPVVAPFVVKALSEVRERYNRMRARRLGVPVEALADFSGKGAALHARIASDGRALHELRSQTTGRSDEDRLAGERFADAAENRLTQLSSVVRAAERMPAARRRAAHRAVDGELGRIEDDLLRRFGV